MTRLRYGYLVTAMPPAQAGGLLHFIGNSGYTITMGLVDRFSRVEELVDRIIENEEKYRIFLDASPWGILVVDQTFRIAFVNKTFERMSGYRFDELAGQHLHYVMPKEDAKIHVKHEKEFVKNPRDRYGNHGLRPRLLTKHGDVVDVEVSISPTRIHGQEFYFSSIRPIETLLDTLPPVPHERAP